MAVPISSPTLHNLLDLTHPNLSYQEIILIAAHYPKLCNLRLKSPNHNNDCMEIKLQLPPLTHVSINCIIFDNQASLHLLI